MDHLVEIQLLNNIYHCPVADTLSLRYLIKYSTKLVKRGNRNNTGNRWRKTTFLVAKLEIFMSNLSTNRDRTHMHNLPKFSFFWTKYVIFTNLWKFCYRWLRLYYSKSTNKLSVLLPALVTHVYGSSITKFSENRKNDVFCSEKWKFG